MSHFTDKLRSPWLAATALAALTLSVAPREASACGGFFCSSSPVDQTAEHILFTVNPNHTVTAYVQIQYVGDKDAFAWIVPVPGIPQLTADFPNLALQALDNGTQPRYSKNSCARNFDANGGLGAPTAAAGNGVTVLAKQLVGPYETVTLEGTSAVVLVQWLRTNGYRITDAMIPFLQPYVEGGMHFVALRLQADKATSDIQPLGMTYDGDKPMIPIRLTAIAAQPEMGIVTWVLSNRRWAPENFVDLKIADSLIEFDQYGFQNNYLTVVSRESDKVGGQAFVTEYAKSTADLAMQVESQGAPTPEAQKAKDALLPLLQQFPYITRMYARMSAEEMTVDPMFMPASDTTDVNNIHDLTDPNFNYNQCGTSTPTPQPCMFTYCGRSGVCVPTLTQAALGAAAAATAQAACVCSGSATARVTTTAGGQPSMYCEPVTSNLDVGSAGASAPLLQAACEGFSCGGHGQCIPINGNPTCQCEGGYGASAEQVYNQATGSSSTKVTCQPVGSSVPSLPVVPKIGQAQVSPAPASDEMSSGGCAVGMRRGGFGTTGFLLALGALALGRRRHQDA